MITDSETNYKTLLEVFKQLYIELDTVEPENLITKEHVLKLPTNAPVSYTHLTLPTNGTV